MAGKKTNGQLGNERVQVVFKTRAPPKNWITLFTNPLQIKPHADGLFLCMAWNKDEQISFIEGRTKVSLAVSRQDLLVPVGWALEVIFQLESLCFLSKI